MVRLRTVSPNQPGWVRRRAGRGFVYLDLDKQRLSGPDLERCRRLVIPPAWQDVWICPADNGHIQAVGIDAAGRRQYLYHEEWRRRRDADKHDRVLKVAKRLPRARDLVERAPDAAGDAAREGTGQLRSGCSTSASSASAARRTPRRTAATGSPR
jgi:DNA topoisomerase IB